MAPIVFLLIGLLPLVSAQGCPFANANKRDLEPSLTTLQHSFGKCPTLSDAAGASTRSRDWWPCQLRLDVLRQFSQEQNPLGSHFEYAAAFATLDCKFPLCIFSKHCILSPIMSLPPFYGLADANPIILQTEHLRRILRHC